jgi:hypothetical protein
MSANGNVVVRLVENRGHRLRPVINHCHQRYDALNLCMIGFQATDVTEQRDICPRLPLPERAGGFSQDLRVLASSLSD